MPTPVAAQVERMAELAWAAGVLDCIGQFVATPRKYPGGWTPRLRAQTRDLKMCHGLKAVMGGHVGPTGKALWWEWSVSGSVAVYGALEDVRPYLHRRGRSGQALAELCERMIHTRSASFEDRSLSEREVVERQGLVDMLRSSRLPKL